MEEEDATDESLTIKVINIHIYVTPEFSLMNSGAIEYVLWKDFIRILYIAPEKTSNSIKLATGDHLV